MASSRLRSRISALAAVLAVTAVTACGSSEPDAAGDDSGTTTLTAGYIPGASLGPAFIGDDFGCLAEEGLEVEYQPISNPADAIAFLGEGRIDVYIGSPSAGMFNMVAKGENLKMVASLGSINTPGDELAASGLFAVEGIDAVEGLEGKRVATIGSVGSATSYLLGTSLETGGLTFGDVEVVTLSGADAAQALKSGGVDGALLIAPYTQQAVAEGYATSIVDSRAAYGEETTAGVLYGPSLLEEDRDTGAKYLRTVACGAEHMQGDWRADSDVVASLAEFLQVPEETISEGGGYVFDPQLVVNEGTLTGMQEMFMAVDGTLTYDTILPTEDLVDAQILTDALG